MVEVGESRHVAISNDDEVDESKQVGESKWKQMTMTKASMNK
jgi:hypothetical protein